MCGTERNVGLCNLLFDFFHSINSLLSHGQMDRTDLCVGNLTEAKLPESQVLVSAGPGFPARRQRADTGVVTRQASRQEGELGFPVRNSNAGEITEQIMYNLCHRAKGLMSAQAQGCVLKTLVLCLKLGTSSHPFLSLGWLTQ